MLYIRKNKKKEVTLFKHNSISAHFFDWTSGSGTEIVSHLGDQDETIDIEIPALLLAIVDIRK